MKYLCSVSRRVLLTRSTTAHLTSGFLQTWNSIPSRFSKVWNWVFKNSKPLSVRTHTGRLRIGFVYLGSWNIDSSAAATSFPVFVRRGTLCKYFQNKSITCSRSNYYIFSSMSDPKYRFPKRRRYWRYMDFWGSVFWGAYATYMHLASPTTPLSDSAFSALALSVYYERD